METPVGLRNVPVPLKTYGPVSSEKSAENPLTGLGQNPTQTQFTQLRRRLCSKIEPVIKQENSNNDQKVAQGRMNTVKKAIENLITRFEENREVDGKKYTKSFILLPDLIEEQRKIESALTDLTKNRTKQTDSFKADIKELNHQLEKIKTSIQEQGIQKIDLSASFDLFVSFEDQYQDSNVSYDDFVKMKEFLEKNYEQMDVATSTNLFDSFKYQYEVSNDSVNDFSNMVKFVKENRKIKDEKIQTMDSIFFLLEKHIDGFRR